MLHGLSCAEWVFAHAERAPAAPAVDSPGLRLPYGALARAIAALAGELRASGFGPGRRLVVALPTCPAGAVALLAAQAAGGCAVPVSRELSDAALRAIVVQTGARHVVAWPGDAGRAWLAPGATRLERVWSARVPGDANTTIREGWSPLGPDGSPLAPAAPPIPAPASVAPPDEALVLFTSGSTADPRGVVQTFRNVAANTRSIVAYLGLGPRDRAMQVLPLFYCYGLSVLQTHLAVGGSVFLEPRGGFAAVVLEGIAAEGCTGFAGVPLTFELLRRSADVAAAPKGRLRYVTQAGGAMSPETTRWARAAFAPARLFVMYGQTEATARLAYLPPERGDEKLGAIGVPIPGVALRVVAVDGRELPAGEVGELVARGENVTPGYLGAPEETAAVFRDDGLHTGDLAYRDPDGFFFVVGRVKEMLKIAGHRVSPAEIERVLHEHPAVEEAAVAGQAHAVQGEVAAAFVVLRPGAAATARELRAFCRSRLPVWCVPAEVHFLAALPRTGSGKLLRRQLASAAAAV